MKLTGADFCEAHCPLCTNARKGNWLAVVLQRIEKACRIRMGHQGLCSAEISDGLTFVRLSNGIVLSTRMAKEMGFIPRESQATTPLESADRQEAQ